MKLFLFNDENGTVAVEPEVFLIKDFNELKVLRKKNKGKLHKELAYIYFYCDLSSDFQLNTNEEQRSIDVRNHVSLPETWKPDEIMLKCMKVYEYLSQTVSSSLLKSCYIAVDKLQTFLSDMDLNERTPAGGPVWNPKIISDIVKGVPDLLKSVQQAEAEFVKGQNLSEKLRGDKLKTFYEDGISSKFIRTD